jgi:hypothetical protein
VAGLGTPYTVLINIWNQHSVHGLCNTLCTVSWEGKIIKGLSAPANPASPTWECVPSSQYSCKKLPGERTQYSGPGSFLNSHCYAQALG